MKLISQICILILIYLLCSGRGCKEDLEVKEKKEANDVQAMRDSIMGLFETEIPGEKDLRSFELTAQQKLIDLADFLKIISDTSLDNRFRQQAFDMAIKLFISGENKIETWSRIYSSPGTNTAEQLLNKSLSNGLPLWAEPVGMSVNKPLTWINDSVYAGSLIFYQRYMPFNDHVKIDTINKRLLLSIYAVRKLKSFGREQIKVWVVNLGDFGDWVEIN